MAKVMRSALVTTVLALSLTACGDDDSGEEVSVGHEATALIARNPDNAARPPITVGSKNFTEEFIVSEIYAQALQAAGYRVVKRLDTGPELVALQALKDGKIDAYPEYTGTALTSFFGVRTEKVPKSPRAAFELTRREFAQIGMVALPQTPFTDSNGFAITQKTAAALGGARRISDLKGREGDLVLSGSAQCAQRTDCKLGLERVYGLRFGRFLVADLTQRHDVLQTGKADVSVVFTTDGRTQAEGLVLLEDDRSMLPPYNVTFVVRKGVLDAAGPDFARAIATVNEGLTTEVMQELNSRVDIDGEPPAEVAKAYLTELGHIG